MYSGLRVLAVSTAVLLCGLSAKAQDPHEAGTPVSVTGCLAQSEQPNMFQIKDDTGKEHALASTKVNLKPHVGHRVTVTGTPMKQEGGKEAAEAKEGDMHLMVTDLKMVSTSCT